MKLLIHSFLALYCFSTLASVESLTSNILTEKSYALDLQDNTWTPFTTLSESQIVMGLESPKKTTTFTLREFDKKAPGTLKKNVHTWLSDYKSYGFDVQNKRPVRLNEQTIGYFIEALHKKTQKRFSQFMSLNKNKLVTLTCQTNQNSDSEFEACKKVLKSFSWKKD